MNEIKKKMYDLSGPKTVEAMKKRHFDAYYCSTAAEAVEKALELIRQLESFERRYFGGLVGYMDAEGNGEWALVLRCAQVSPDEAVLYAGAGIVAESDPELEHTETGTKLGSFGRALGVETLGEDTP